MGLKPGESDCNRCQLRPLFEGGSGRCPYKDAVLRLYQEGKYPCPKFVEGDFFRKRDSNNRALPKQSEGLF